MDESKPARKLVGAALAAQNAREAREREAAVIQQNHEAEAAARNAASAGLTDEVEPSEVVGVADADELDEADGPLLDADFKFEPGVGAGSWDAPDIDPMEQIKARQNRTTNRDPQTSRTIPGLRADIETADATDAAAPHPEIKPDPNAGGFKPYRLWTAGPTTPQVKVRLPGGRDLKPLAYAYQVRNRTEEQALRKSIPKARWWKDDVPDGQPWPKCETCPWECGSNAAMIYHLNHAHGRSQEQ